MPDTPCQGGDIKVLLVDPSQEDRRKIMKQMQKCEVFTVHECSDAEQVIERWLERLHEIDILVLEHALPGNSGLDLVRLLVLEPHCPPLVVFTGSGSESAAAAYLRLGVQDYLIKEDQERMFGALPLVLRRLVKAEREKRRQHEMAQGLAGENTRLRALVDALPMGLMFLSRGHRVLDMNRTALAITGQADETWRGAPCEEVLRTDVCGPDCPTRRIMAGTAKAEPVECHAYTGDGKKLPLCYNAAPVKDAKGRLSGSVVMFSDITGHLALEQEQATFLSMLAHDMKTPLVSILGFARYMLEKGEVLNARQRRSHTEVIVREGARLEKLVTDFLNSARQDRAELHFNLASVNVVDLAVSVASSYALRGPNEPQAIALDVPAQPIYIQMDQDRMRQALGNLLDNALRHSPQGEQVVLSVQDNGYECVLEVADRGCGIHQDDLPHIFQPYFQGRGRPNQNGYGLGLAGVKSIVEGQGGVIRASCPPQGGTVFSVLLPREMPRLDAVS